jgi:uncharacterized protein YxeA
MMMMMMIMIIIIIIIIIMNKLSSNKNITDRNCKFRLYQKSGEKVDQIITASTILAQQKCIKKT